MSLDEIIIKSSVNNKQNLNSISIYLLYEISKVFCLLLTIYWLFQHNLSTKTLNLHECKIADSLKTEQRSAELIRSFVRSCRYFNT